MTFPDIHAAIAAVLPSPGDRPIPWELAPRIRPVGRDDIALVVTISPNEWASARPRLGLVSTSALTTVDHSVRVDDPRIIDLLAHRGLWEVVDVPFDPDARYDWGLWKSPDGYEITIAPLHLGPCEHRRRPRTCECTRHQLVATFESCTMTEAGIRRDEMMGW